MMGNWADTNLCKLVVFFIFLFLFIFFFFSSNSLVLDFFHFFLWWLTSKHFYMGYLLRFLVYLFWYSYVSKLAWSFTHIIPRNPILPVCVHLFLKFSITLNTRLKPYNKHGLTILNTDFSAKKIQELEYVTCTTINTKFIWS